MWFLPKLFLKLAYWLIRIPCSILPIWAVLLLSCALGYFTYPKVSLVLSQCLGEQYLAEFSLGASVAFSLLLLIPGLAGSWARGKRKKLIRQASSVEMLQALDWREFELLVCEAYRKSGYRVIDLGGADPDGGIDAEAYSRRDGRLIIQCKHWKTEKVGVKIVRETLGVLHKVGADRAVVVVSGRFTRAAVAFAEDVDVDLVDGEALIEMLDH